MRKFLAILGFLLCSAPAWATTYYVDNCVVVGNDSNNGTSTATPWLTLAKASTASYTPGDSILFARTCVWREAAGLLASSSGTAGNVITYDAYGTGALPVFNGATLMSGWSLVSGNVWQATLTTPTNQVFFNGVLGTQMGSQGAVLPPNQWFWATNVLYVYSTSNPTTAFRSPGIEASVEVAGMGTASKSYLLIQNLEFKYANNSGAYVNGTSAFTTYNAIKADFNFNSGIVFVGTGGPVETNNSLTNSELAFNGSNGVSVVDYNNNVTISNNNIHHNSLGSGTFTSGVHICSSTLGLINGVVVKYNNVYSNGGPLTGSFSGSGIWADCAPTGVVFAYNHSHNNLQLGLYLEITSGAQVYGNISDNNGQTGLYISSHTNTAANNNLVYNNTIVYNGGGIFIGADHSAPSMLVGNQIINNISVGNGVFQFGACWAQNDGTYSSENVYTFNSFGPPSTNFIEWNCVPALSTYAAFDAAYGSATNSITTDPKLLANFSLNSGSPCIDTATNLGATYQLELSPVPSFPTMWPNNVALANENSYGAGWDVGAFVYLNSPSLPLSPPTITGVKVQ